MSLQKIAEDLGRFVYDPLGYVLWAFKWGQGELYNASGPRKWQRDYLEDLGKQLLDRGFDGINPVSPVRKSTASGHGIGKVLNDFSLLDTPFDGKKLGKDFKVGDYIFGIDGLPNKIIQIHPRYNLPVYRVWLDDGSFTDVAEEHLWSVRGRQERRNGLLGYRTLSTGDILKLGVKRKNGKTFARQWELPEYSPVIFNNNRNKTKLPSYYVGSWLGNGSKGEPRLTVRYEETIIELKRLFKKVSVNKCEGKNCSTVRPLGISKLIKQQDMFGKTCCEKYISDEYKYSSVKNRIELLRGLLDSDGEVSKTGSIAYSSTSERLVNDIIWLARSLGLKAMLQPTVKQGRCNGEDKRLCYRCTIASNGKFDLFYTKARLERVKKEYQDRYSKRWIDRIEILPSSTGRCITVERQDGLYLTNDFIVTHNSALVAWLIKWIMDTRPFCKGVVTATTSDQLRTKTWAEVAKWHKNSITEFMCSYHNVRGGMYICNKEYPETWRCDAITCKEENSEAFAGLHAASSTPFYIFDEASGVPKKIFEVAQGGLTDGEPIMLLFGNPTQNTGYFFDSFNSLAHRFTPLRIDSRTVEGTNKELFEQWVKDYGEDSDYVRVRVRGLHPRASIMQLIPNDLVQEAMRRKIPRHVYYAMPRILGADVAWYGDDRSVQWIRQGKASKILWQGREVDSVTQAGLLNQWENKFRTKATFIDAGYGTGVIDQLRALGKSPIPVWFNGKSTRTDCANKRAEMWVKLLEWLKEGGALPFNNDIETDLCGVEYYMNLNGQIMLEKKEDMKKRGLQSPDLGDGLALTFAEDIGNIDDIPLRGNYGNDKQVKIDYNVLDFSDSSADVVETDYDFL